MENYQRVAREVLALAIADSKVEVGAGDVSWETTKKRQRLVDEAKQFLSNGEYLEFWCELAGLKAQYIREKFGN